MQRGAKFSDRFNSAEIFDKEIHSIDVGRELTDFSIVGKHGLDSMDTSLRHTQTIEVGHRF